jgi:hypothetical protein
MARSSTAPGTGTCPVAGLLRPGRFCSDEEHSWRGGEARWRPASRRHAPRKLLGAATWHFVSGCAEKHTHGVVDLPINSLGCPGKEPRLVRRLTHKRRSRCAQSALCWQTIERIRAERLEVAAGRAIELGAKTYGSVHPSSTTSSIGAPRQGAERTRASRPAST